jgi:hypothetical protein
MRIMNGCFKRLVTHHANKVIAELVQQANVEFID